MKAQDDLVFIRFPHRKQCFCVSLFDANMHITPSICLLLSLYGSSITATPIDWSFLIETTTQSQSNGQLSSEIQECDLARRESCRHECSPLMSDMENSISDNSINSNTTLDCKSLFVCTRCIHRDHKEPECMGVNQQYQLLATNARDAIAHMICIPMNYSTERRTEISTAHSNQGFSTTSHSLETTTMKITESEGDLRCLDSRKDYCLSQCYRESRCDRLYSCAECMMQDRNESACQGEDVDKANVNDQVLFNLILISQSVCTQEEITLHKQRIETTKRP
jgi:hypothetical protein